jgi:hypothetical protein
LGFFAAESDQRAVLDFLFSSTDVRVFGSYSEYDADLREFCSTDELVAVFPIGIDRHGNGTAVLLQLWSPSVMSELNIERFALDPSELQVQSAQPVKFDHLTAGSLRPTRCLPRE